MPGEPPASRPAAIAQTAERTPRKRQVAGSCPARGSNGSRAPSGAGPSLPLAPSRTASLSLTAGPTFAGMGRPIRFLRGRRPAAGRLVRNEEVAGSNPAGSTTRNASKSEHNHTGVSPTRETHKLTADPLPAVRVEGEGTPPWPGEGGHAVPVRIRVGARRRIGGTLILRGNSQNVRASPGVPARRNTGMDGGPCGKGAVLLRLLGAEVPGEFDSRTIRLPICSDRPRDRAFGIQSAKRVDRQWRNAVGHTCPAHSRTFPHGVTAAHGSLEPLVLVRNQVRERFRRLLQTDWKRSAKPWERVRLPYSPLSGSNIRFDFFLYTRHDSCTGHTGNQASPKPRKRRHALVAQWIERPSPERKVTSPILVEGTHETPPIIMRGVIPLLFSLTPSRLVRLVHHEATPL